jgi:hypothetical protein
MRRLSIVILAFFCNIQNISAQRADEIKLKHELVAHILFDGSVNATVNSRQIELLFSKDPFTKFQRSNFNYKMDSAIVIGESSKSSLYINDRYTKDNSLVSYAFWFNVHKDTIQSQDSSLRSNQNFVFKFFNEDECLITLQTDNNRGQLVFTLNGKNDTLMHIELDKYYLFVMTLNEQSDSTNSTLGVYSPQQSGNKINLVPVKFLLNTYKVFQKKIKEHFLVKLSAYDQLTTNFGVLGNKRNITINDFRIYNRVVDKTDLSYLASFDLDDGIEDLKLELALVYKKIADEYFIAEDFKNALNYYSKAEQYVDSTKSTAVRSYKLTTAGALRPHYLKLLQKDIVYRKMLLDMGYGFWGIEYSTTPLFPSEEIKKFEVAFNEFRKIYDKIVELQDKNYQVSETQVREQIKSSQIAYQHQIDLQRKEIANTNIDFYSDQVKSTQDRIKAIETEQILIDRQVAQYEGELKQNEKKMMSTLSRAISQSAIGVRIDLSQSLNSNFKNLAYSYLSSNPEIKDALLSSCHDVISTVQASYDYYNKAKQALSIIEKAVSGSVSPEDILLMGDAVVNMGLIDNSTTKEWIKLKSSYGSFQNLQTKARQLIQTASQLNSGDLHSWVQLTNWIAESGYFTKYDKAFKEFQGFQEIAYETFQEKKYDALRSLGKGILDSIQTGLPGSVTSSLRATVSQLKQQYGKLRPLYTAIQLSKNDSLIKSTLFNLLFDPAIQEHFNRKPAIDEFFWKELGVLFMTTQNFRTREYIVKELSNHAPALIVTLFPTDAKIELRDILKVGNDQDLYEKIKSFANQWQILHDSGLVLTIAGEEILRFQGESITIRGVHYKLYFDPIKRLTAGPLLIHIKRLIGNSDFKYEMLRQIKTSAFVTLFSDNNLTPPEINPARKQDIYDLLSARLSTAGLKDKDNLIKEEAFELAVGGLVMQSFIQDKQQTLENEIPPIDIENFYRSEQNGSEASDQMMRDMAYKAVDMAFPGIGTALGAVVETLAVLFDNADLIKQLKDRYNQKIALRTELLKQLENLQASRHHSRLAILERDIANINLELSGVKNAEYTKMINMVLGDRKREIRMRIAGQLPLFYYYAERLRNLMYRVNRASAFWYGTNNELKKLVYGDNNNIRLAIDESIRLFDWIEAPDITSSRQDVDSIFHYWQRHSALVNSYRTSLIYGDASRNESEIEMLPISFKKSFPDQWAEFQKWQRMIGVEKQEIFPFKLDLAGPLAQFNQWQFDESFSSIKTIQVGMHPCDGTGKYLQLVGELKHPGISVSETGNLQILKSKLPMAATEIRLFVSTAGNIEIQDMGITNDLKSRWANTQKDYVPRYFEGYNLRTVWEYNVFPKNQAKNINDIYLLFVYQFSRQEPAIGVSSLKYRYKVTIKRTPTSKLMTFEVICTEKEMQNYSYSINDALINRSIVEGKIEPISKNGSKEIYYAY